MSLPSTIAKNTTYLSLSSIFQKLLAFWWFSYIAAQLGENWMGRYIFALGFTGIFVIFMNFGLIPVLTREGAKRPDQLPALLNTIISLKVFLTALSLITMFSVFYILNLFKELPTATIQLVYMASIIIVIDTFRSIVLAVLRAHQAMQYEAIGQFLYQLVVVGCGAVMLWLGYGAMGLIIAISIASCFYLLYSVIIVLRRYNIAWQWQWDTTIIKRLIRLAIPFALADIFFKLNGSVDTVMLEYLAGDRFVTWYNIALKLTVTLTVIPGAFATAFFPAMSRAVQHSTVELQAIFERAMEYLLIISLPIACGTAVLAPTIIAVGFPAFPAATIALQIFMAGLVFIFINYPIGNLLNAANRQGTNTLNMGIALLVNIVLNSILISQYTYVGAAIAAVVSSVVLVVLGLPHVYQIVQFNIQALLWRFVKTLVASVVMAGSVLWLQPYLSLLGLVGIGIVIYGLVLYLLRGISWSECQQLYRSLLSRT